MLASKLNVVANFENLWDVALIESIDATCRCLTCPRWKGAISIRSKGSRSRYSPRNAFFVSLTPKIVGVSFPANRQDLGRWLRSLKRHEKPQVSEYLQNAVTLAHGKDQVVVALDLGDLFTSRQVRDRLHGAESLAGKEVDLDAITKVITSIKGVTFTVEATDRLNGKMRVDFGESPSPAEAGCQGLVVRGDRE